MRPGSPTVRPSGAPAGRRLGSYLVDRRPLRLPAFRRLWLASAVTAVGGSFSLVAVPAQLFALTGSSATVGASAGVSFSALVAGSLAAGSLADAVDRRLLLLVAHAGQFVTYALLCLQAAAGWRSVPVLLVLVACQGAGYGTIMTTTGAAVPRLVPVELLAAAASLSSLVRYTGAVVGPLLAGVLMSAVGLGPLYLCDALALLAVLWAVFRLPSIRPDAGPAAGQGTILAGIGSGFGYLVGHRLLVAVLGIDLAAMVFGMPSALFPELARRSFAGPAGGGAVLGMLYAAYPAGVLAAGLLSGTFSRARRHGTLLAAAAIGWGLTVILFGLAAPLWAALLALAAGGAVNALLSAFRTAITQAATDDAVRGRIQGALTIVLTGGPQTAAVLHGVAGATLGARTTICLGGLLTALTTMAIALTVPELRRYRSA